MTGRAKPPPALRYPLPRGFTESVRRLFELQGYLHIPGVLSAEALSSVRQATDALPLPNRGDLRPLLPHAGPFLDLLDHERVLPAVLALMGGTVQAVSSTATVVPPGADPMTWHEDGPRPWSYPSVDGRRPLNLLRVGYFLDDLQDDTSGNLVVVPGSHQIPFHRAPTPQPGRAMPGSKTLRVRAGDVVAFHNGLWHSTAPNRRSTARVVLYLAFAPSWHRLIDYLAPPTPLLDALEPLAPGRRALLRQLVGATPESGPHGFMFPSPGEMPGLNLIDPEHPASGS